MYSLVYGQPKSSSDFNSLFDSFFNFPAHKNQRNSYLKVVEDNYVFTMDIPGVKKEQVSVEYKRGMIEITAKNDTREYFYSFPVSQTKADIANSVVQIEDGVLTISTPMIREAKDKGVLKLL